MTSQTKPNLQQDLVGLRFDHPFVPSAGPNNDVGKSGQIDLLLRVFKNSGFPFVKTLGPEDMPEKVPEFNMAEALIGREKFFYNSEISSVHPRSWWLNALKELHEKHGFRKPIMSVGYSMGDIVELSEMFAPHLSAFELSAHHGNRKEYFALVDKLKATGLPLFAKITPSFHSSQGVNNNDEKEFEDCMLELIEHDIDGFIAVNSIGPAYALYAKGPLAGTPILGGEGWLSGSPIRPVGLSYVDRIARILEARGEVERRPIIGVGGISKLRDALLYFAAGATGIGICTAAVLEGPEIYIRLANELSEFLAKNGYSDIVAFRRDMRHNPERRDALLKQKGMNWEKHGPKASWQELTAHVIWLKNPQDLPVEEVHPLRPVREVYRYEKIPTFSAEACVECKVCYAEDSCTRSAIHFEYSDPEHGRPAPTLTFDPDLCES
ncbi:MAG: hypothetical protein V2A74_02820, partial [bacterium]